MRRTHPRTGFTIVELLVVVAIIVVLLALLAPALDKAIYQAELAVCAAQQRGIVTSGQQYAMSFKRAYPHRVGMRANWEPEMLKDANPNTRAETDLRKMMLDYLDTKILVDPLCLKVDLSIKGNPDPATEIYSSYNLWWDAQYNSGAIRYKGMFKVGDRFTWQEPNSPNSTEYSFGMIVNDRDTYAPVGGGEAHFSHPDADGVMAAQRYQTQPFTSGGVTNPGITLSFWRSQATYQRGPVDGNYGYDDGSVRRYTRVGLGDERMVRIPEWVNHHDWANGTRWGTQVPKNN